MTLVPLKSKTLQIAICAWVLGGVGIGLAVLPAYSWLSMTSFPDALAHALTRIFGASAAAVLLIYTLGSLVSAVIGLCVSFLVGLLVHPARSSTGLWMGLIAGVTYLGLAIASNVQPRLVTFLELAFLIAACLVGIGSARWSWERLDSRKAPTT